MNRRLLQIALACLPLAALAGNGDEAMPRPNWTPEAANAVQDRKAARAELAELCRLARLGRSDELRWRVEAIAGGDDRPAPERDYILYELALALAELAIEAGLPAGVGQPSTVLSRMSRGHPQGWPRRRLGGPRKGRNRAVSRPNVHADHGIWGSDNGEIRHL